MDKPNQTSLSITKIYSHTLAKQIYIPIGIDEYHLVSPMYSSSLAHEIALAIKASKDKTNPVNQAKKQNKWHEETYVFYPNIATLGVTKSMHQKRLFFEWSKKWLVALISIASAQMECQPNATYSYWRYFKKKLSKRVI